MMATISQNAQLSRRYTNHCLRATAITILDAANFASRYIMTFSGHKAESSLKTYSKTTSEEIKRKMSSTLCKSLVSNVNEESQLPLPEGSTVDLQLPIPEISTNDLQHERSPILPTLSDSQESRLLEHFTPSEEIPDVFLQILNFQPVYALNNQV